MAKSSSNNQKVNSQQVINDDKHIYDYDYLKLQVENCNLKLDKLTLLVEKYILQIDKSILNNGNIFSNDEHVISNDDKRILKDSKIINNTDNLISDVDKKLQQEKLQSAISEHLIDNFMKKSNKFTKDRLNQMALFLFEKEEIKYGELRKRYGLSVAQFSRDMSLLYASGFFKSIRKSMTNYIVLTEKGKELKKTAQTPDA